MDEVLTYMWGLPMPIICRDNTRIACLGTVNYKVLNVAVKDQCEGLLKQELIEFITNLSGKYNTAAEVINAASLNEFLAYHQNSQMVNIYEIVSVEFRLHQA